MPPLSPAQRAALLATARVAGAVALVACSKPATTPAPEAAPAEAPAGPEAAASVDTDGVAPDLATCATEISEAFDDDWVAAKEGERLAARATPRQRACCVALLEDAWERSQAPAWEGRWSCCAIVGRNGSELAQMACTPWGPPAPPAFA